MPVADLVQCPGAVAQPAGLGQHGLGQRLEVDLGGHEEVGAPALGQQDQVADEAGHPVDLVEQQLLGLRALGRVVGVEELEVAAQRP